MQLDSEQRSRLAHRDFTPIECLPDDCLLKDYDVALPWKNETTSLHAITE